MKKLLIVYAVGAMFSSCVTQRVEVPGMPGHYTEEQVPIFGFSFKGKKQMRLSQSYPPPGFVNGMKKYHKRFNSWPRTLNDLFYISLEAQKDVRKMLDTHYSDIEMQNWKPDTIEVFYKYHKIPKEEVRKSDQILLNDRAVKRKYIFVYNRKDSSVHVENLNVK